MELKPISDRQGVVPTPGGQGEQEKSLGDMFSDLLQKITGTEAARAAASHAFGIDALPTLQVAPLRERVEVTVEDSPEEEISESPEEQTAQTQNSENSAKESVENSTVVVSVIAKEVVTAKEQSTDVAAVQSNQGTVASVKGEPEATTQAAQFQISKTAPAAVDEARNIVQMNNDQAPAATPVAAPVEDEVSQEITAVPARAKSARGDGTAPSLNASVDSMADDAAMTPTLSVLPKTKEQASPAAEYTKLQMLLNNGAGAASSDLAAARAATNGDTSSRVMNAVSGAGEGVQIADRAKAVSRLAPAQQAKTIERIQQILSQAIRTRDLNTIVVKLEPLDLGKLTVKLTQRGDELFARIKPENPEVEKLLQQKLPEITGVLAQSGLKLDNVHVSIGTERADGEFFGYEHFLGRNSAQGDAGNSGGDFERGREFNGQGMAEAISLPQTHSELDASWIA